MYNFLSKEVFMTSRICFLFIICIFALALVFILHLRVPAPEYNDSNSKPLKFEIRTRNSEVSVLIEPEDEIYGELHIAIDRLDVRKMCLFLDVELSVSRHILENLTKASDATPAVIVTKEGVQLHPEFQTEECEITFLPMDSDYQGRFDRNIRIPLRDLFKTTPMTHAFLGGTQGGFACYRIKYEINLPLEGHPKVYPNDWYEMEQFIGLQLPACLALEKVISENQFGIPLKVTLSAKPTMHDFNIQIFRDEDKSSPMVRIKFTHTRWTLLFVYINLLIPFLLVLLFSILLIHAKKIVLHETILATAGVIFCILPIRTLLMPDEFGLMTLVDLILSFSVILAFAILFLKFIDFLKDYHR